MTEIRIPAGLPLLRGGVGRNPEDGGCLVQLASYLSDGVSWTDRTPCVHPVLAEAAIAVNDRVEDYYRPVLAPLAAELVGTGTGQRPGKPGRVLNTRLALWCADRTAALRTPRRRAHCARLLAAARAWADCPCDAHWWQVRPGAGPDQWGPADGIALCAAQATHARRDPSVNAARRAARGAVFALVNNATVGVDQTLGDFLTGLVAEHRRLTGHTPQPAQRWDRACELIGATR
ncbi:MAG: hypothetical protein GEU83_15135 [Pseudonocardiaceae bacterium]|nr:hypothetical protein [Pseudonocardiaceae bacterium]